MFDRGGGKTACRKTWHGYMVVKVHLERIYIYPERALYNDRQIHMCINAFSNLQNEVPLKCCIAASLAMLECTKTGQNRT